MGFVVSVYHQIYWATVYQTFWYPGYQYVQWWTYVVKGLHKNDFIIAAKTDEVYEKKARKGRFFITLLESQH